MMPRARRARAAGSAASAAARPPRPPWPSPGGGRDATGSRPPGSPRRGVRISPSPPPAPVASCSRRTGVSAGGAGSSASTRGQAPERSASSMHHSMSRGWRGAAITSRAGSNQGASPSAWGHSGAWAGRIHSTGPDRRAATSRASARRDGPHSSCTRPGARDSPGSSVGPGACRAVGIASITGMFAVCSHRRTPPASPTAAPPRAGSGARRGSTPPRRAPRHRSPPHGSRRGSPPARRHW